MAFCKNICGPNREFCSSLQYDDFMEKIFLEVFGPLVVAFGLLVLVTGIRRSWHRLRAPSTEALREAREEFRERLVRPNPLQVEKGMGGKLPQSVIELYDDSPTVLSEQIEIRHPAPNAEDSVEWIAAFLPLDLESQKYVIDLVKAGWGKGFCFATDGSGNFYWVPLSDSRQTDAPVFYACHDPWGNEKVADSLTEFLSWPRAAATPDAEIAE